MDSDILESILSRLYCKMCLKKRKAVLFWDNGTCRPETLQASFAKIKLSFLPKNTKYGIIRDFKHKCWKLLVRYVLSRIDVGKVASQIIEDIDILKAITWRQAWKISSMEIIKQSF